MASPGNISIRMSPIVTSSFCDTFGENEPTNHQAGINGDPMIEKESGSNFQTLQAEKNVQNLESPKHLIGWI